MTDDITMETESKEDQTLSLSTTATVPVLESNKSEKDAITTTATTTTKSGSTNVADDSFDDQVDYKHKYRNLKRKLKSLLYEQECFHEELRKTQRKCLRVSRDKSFLLDRLLQYEAPDLSSDDDEATDSSSDEDVSGTYGNGSKKSSSASVTGSKSNKATTNKSSSGVKNADKIRCKHVDEKSGKRCSKLVNKKVVSGTCQSHRPTQPVTSKDNESTTKSPTHAKTSPTKTSVPIVEEEEKVKSSSPPPEQTPPVKRPVAGGGKDIGQFREAMEASGQLQEDSDSSDSSANVEEDELIIDVP